MPTKNSIMILVKKHLKYILASFIIIFCSLLYMYIKPNNYNMRPTITVNDDIILEEVKTVQEEVISTIFVDIKGAINAPGVYELTSGSRVVDAIKMSGGLKSNADTSMINLSKKIEDEMVIIVYSKVETEKMKSENAVIKYIEKECNCPVVSNDACITINNTDENGNNDLSDNKKISLNNATIEELETLPGIGNSKAVEIINYREEHGGFKTIEELQEISGIGSVTFEKLKDLVTI